MKIGQEVTEIIKVRPPGADSRPQGEFPGRELTIMEISPVSGVRIASMVRSRETVLGMPGVFEVEYSSRTEDESYSPASTKAASGAEEDEDGEEESDEAEEGKSESRVRAVEGAAKKQINYFV